MSPKRDARLRDKHPCSAGYGGSAISGATPSNTDTDATFALATAEMTSDGFTLAAIPSGVITAGNNPGGLVDGTFANMGLYGGTAGEGALATVVVASGSISSVTVTARGSSYVNGEIITIQWGCTACLANTFKSSVDNSQCLACSDNSVSLQGLAPITFTIYS